jgi:NADH-quinone oxidoreductase subunit K
MLPLEHVIGLSAILFVIGMIGVATRRNLIVVLMSIELMLNAVNLAFVGFNRLWPGTAAAPALDGQVFVLMVITVAAAEVAVGLGIVISLFRNRDSVDLEEVSLLKW